MGLTTLQQLVFLFVIESFLLVLAVLKIAELSRIPECEPDTSWERLSLDLENRYLRLELETLKMRIGCLIRERVGISDDIFCIELTELYNTTLPGR